MSQTPARTQLAIMHLAAVFRTQDEKEIWRKSRGHTRSHRGRETACAASALHHGEHTQVEHRRLRTGQLRGVAPSVRVLLLATIEKNDWTLMRHEF